MYNQSFPSYCYAHLPRAGLGNMLFVWAHAAIFANLNGLPLVTSPWNQFKIGVYLRRERRKREYADYFSGLEEWSSLKSTWMLRNYTPVVEPPITSFKFVQDAQKSLYVFEKIPHWADFFRDIKPHRQFITNELERMLAPHHAEVLKCARIPVIGVHVRCGDFRPLGSGEDFAKVGGVRTPLTYFENIIVGIRHLRGLPLPVTIFSDGTDEELSVLLKLPNVSRAENNADIVDLLLLSKSQIIVTSAGSTFSYWSGFLSHAPVIIHPDHIHSPLRPQEVNEQYFEGGVLGDPQTWPLLLQQNINKMFV
jgi:hypothetical protein